MNFKQKMKFKSAADLAKAEMEMETKLLELPADRFRPDPNQPRKHFDEESLAKLQHTIEMEGQLQPIIVRPLAPGETQHHIISGERRWRAIKSSNSVKTVMAVVRTQQQDDSLKERLAEHLSVDEDTISDAMLTNLMQISENNDREDTTCLENAVSYQRIVDNFKGDRKLASKALNMSYSMLSKYLQLPKSSAEVRKLSEDGLSQDLSTLLNVEGLMNTDPKAAAIVIGNWKEVAESGVNMRAYAAEKLKDSKAEKATKTPKAKKASKTGSDKKKEPSVTSFKSLSSVTVRRDIKGMKETSGAVLSMKVGASTIEYRISETLMDSLRAQLGKESSND